MKVNSAVIEFRSTNEWYWLEESGEKPNTVRLMDEDEMRSVVVKKPKSICITLLSDESVSFVRPISGIHYLDSLLGKHLVMFCWR